MVLSDFPFRIFMNLSEIFCFSSKNFIELFKEIFICTTNKAFHKTMETFQPIFQQYISSDIFELLRFRICSVFIWLIVFDIFATTEFDIRNCVIIVGNCDIKPWRTAFKATTLLSINSQKCDFRIVKFFRFIIQQFREYVIESTGLSANSPTICEYTPMFEAFILWRFLPST